MYTSSFLCSSDKEGGPLEETVRGLISKFGGEDVLTQEKMAEIWRAVAGVRAAKHSMPHSLRRARLIVNVDGSAWLYELTLKKKELVKRFEKALPKCGGRARRVREIQFRIGEV